MPKKPSLVILKKEGLPETDRKISQFALSRIADLLQRADHLRSQALTIVERELHSKFLHGHPEKTPVAKGNLKLTIEPSGDLHIFDPYQVLLDLQPVRYLEYHVSRIGCTIVIERTPPLYPPKKNHRDREP